MYVPCGDRTCWKRQSDVRRCPPGAFFCKLGCYRKNGENEQALDSKLISHSHLQRARSLHRPNEACWSTTTPQQSRINDTQAMCTLRYYNSLPKRHSAPPGVQESFSLASQPATALVLTPIHPMYSKQGAEKLILPLDDIRSVERFSCNSQLHLKTGNHGTVALDELTRNGHDILLAILHNHGLSHHIVQKMPRTQASGPPPPTQTQLDFEAIQAEYMTRESYGSELSRRWHHVWFHITELSSTVCDGACVYHCAREGREPEMSPQHGDDPPSRRIHHLPSGLSVEESDSDCSYL